MKIIPKVYLPALISLTIVLANSWHVIAAWLAKPQGTVFTGIAHYYADYFLYTSLMAQNGWIFTSHLFTNELLSPTWIYWLYTLLGKLGNPFLIYNISVIVFSLLLLRIWWNLMGAVIPQDGGRRLTAFTVLAVASGFAGRDFWFSPFPALNRLGGVPHQIFQTMLLIGILLLFHRRRYLLLSALSFVAATANPIQMLLLAVSLAVVRPSILPYLLPAAAGAWLTQAEFASQQVLTAAKAWENSQNFSVSVLQFVLALGPVAVFIPFGVRPLLKHPSDIRRALMAFGILSVAVFLSPLPILLDTSPVRWLSPAAYAVIPVLAAFGIFEAAALIHSVMKPIPQRGIAAALLVTFMILSAWSVEAQVRARMQSPAHLMYVPRQIIARLADVPDEGTVLMDPGLPYDVIVPVFTGNKTFTGHPIHTLYPQVKEELRRKYFSGAMTPSETQRFVADHGITAIIRK